MCKRIPLCLLLSALMAGSFSGGATAALATEKQTESQPAVNHAVYEMRTYYAHEGKWDAMLERFEKYTLDLFKKHGMHSVVYLINTEPENPRLVYFLGYPSREAREASWKAFLADPEWQQVYKASHENGPIVKKIDSVLLKPTDYSPQLAVPQQTVETANVETAKPERLFELRTYTASAGNLAALNSRFRDHTLKLFQQHGMTNLIYFDLLADQPGAENTLVYLLAHTDEKSRENSFQQFRNNPEWQAARSASEQKAGGSLTVPNGVKSELFQPATFSPIR